MRGCHTTVSDMYPHRHNLLNAQVLPKVFMELLPPNWDALLPKPKTEAQ